MFIQHKSLFFSFLLISIAPCANNLAIQSIALPDQFTQSIQHDISSDVLFTSLSITEKKLFLEALFCLFIGSSLQATEQSLKAHMHVALYEQKLTDNITEQLTRFSAQLQKIHELQNSIQARKQTCFTAIQANAQAVIPAIEHVRSNGQAATVHALTALEATLGDYNQKISAMIAIITHNMLETQKNLGKPDMQTYGDNIPACVVQFDNTMTICNTLKASCSDLEKTLTVRLYIANAVIETGLKLLNLYYTTIYQQVIKEPCNKESNGVMQLPPDLIAAHHALLQNLNSPV